MVGPADGTASGALAFCDLAGFTAFTAERGDDAALALVQEFRSYVVDSLPRGARIVNRIGDGLLLHFGDPGTAISALLAVTDRCATVATPDTPLWVRTGVHVGTARVLGDDLIGHDVNVAARIGDLAAAAEVLASERARDAAADGTVRFDPMGPVFLKGLAEPLRVFRASHVDVPVPATTTPTRSVDA